MDFGAMFDGFWTYFGWNLGGFVCGMGMFLLKHAFMLFLLFSRYFLNIFLQGGFVWMPWGMSSHSFPPVFLSVSLVF